MATVVLNAKRHTPGTLAPGELRTRRRWAVDAKQAEIDARLEGAPR